MKWSIGEPQYGDMIRVKAGSVLHYGIFVSDGEVIQFGQSPVLGVKPVEDVAVLSTDIDAFLQGEFLEVASFDKRERRKKYAPDQVVKNARMRIGEKGYDLLQNNCEHFAYECVFGVHKSEQVEKAMPTFAQPIVDVYYARVAKKIRLSSIFPRARRAEIESCSNEKVRLEKYSVWKLLAYALKKSLGFSCKKINFKKEENGRWVCDRGYFSLSHSGELVAVAVSNYPVGIDVEVVKSHSESVAKKIFSDGELQEFLHLSLDERTEFFIEKWTQKESVYKQRGSGRFEPNTTGDFYGESKMIDAGGQRYCLSVASDKIQALQIFHNVIVK